MAVYNPLPLSSTRSTSELSGTKRKAQYQPPARSGKKPKSKALISDDSDKPTPTYSVESEGESEIQVVAPAKGKSGAKGKGKESAKGLDTVKVKAAKKVTETGTTKVLPTSGELGPYDLTLHTKYDDKCKCCLKRDKNSICYFITANLMGTRNYYLARRLGHPKMGNRPDNHSCVHCIHGRKGDCISPPNRLIVGPDFSLSQMYTHGKAIANSYFLYKFLGRDEAGDLLEDFQYDLEEIKANRQNPQEKDITKPDPVSLGRKAGGTSAKGQSGKKKMVVEIATKGRRGASRAAAQSEFVEGSSGHLMDVDEVEADAEEED